MESRSQKMSIPFIMEIVLLSIISFCMNVNGIKWLATSGRRTWHKEMCSLPQFHLTKKQQALCRTEIDTMRYISESALNVKKECVSKFKYSKWDCKSINRAPYFTYDLLNKTREAAVVHAMSAASLAHNIASKCATGTMKNCACKHAIVLGSIRFPQKVCATSLNKAIAFAKEFIEPGTKKLKKVQQKSLKKLAELEIVQHNRDVGFQILRQMREVKCICPGTTAACQVKTCYRVLPKFQNITEELKKRYKVARRMKIFTEHGGYAPANSNKTDVSKDELVYTDKSVNSCNTTEKLLQVSGRTCSLDPNAENYCKTFCCGGRYESRKVITRKQCNCTFVWCCQLKCDVCYTQPIRQFCL